MLHISDRVRRNAKSMRRVMTAAELKLWNELRAHRLMGLAFRRQVPIAGYIVDFACSSERRIVEVDGSQHGEDEGARTDAVRTRRLEEDGWTILRFWNDDILRDIDNVCRHIVISTGLMAEDAKLRTSSHAPGGESKRASNAQWEN